MSFLKAFAVVKALEGGKHKANDRDANDTNCGIIQSTWEGLGFRGSVLNASDSDIASAYNSLWTHGGASVFDPETNAPRSLFEMMPEPADAFAFQFYINVPPTAFRKALQGVLGVIVDGSLGPNTLRALAKLDKTVLVNRLEAAQRQHYIDNASEENLSGLLNRVDRAYILCYTET